MECGRAAAALVLRGALLAGACLPLPWQTAHASGSETVLPGLLAAKPFCGEGISRSAMVANGDVCTGF